MKPYFWHIWWQFLANASIPEKHFRQDDEDDRYIYHIPSCVYDSSVEEWLAECHLSWVILSVYHGISLSTRRYSAVIPSISLQDCEQSDHQLYDVLYEQYAKTLFVFVDSLLLNPVWKPLYFKKYQAKLRKLPLGFIRKKFPKNDALYVELLKWMPVLRKAIRKMKS